MKIIHINGFSDRYFNACECLSAIFINQDSITNRYFYYVAHVLHWMARSISIKPTLENRRLLQAV